MAVPNGAIVTLVRSEAGRRGAALMLDSLRSFGGVLKDFPVYVFDSAFDPDASFGSEVPGVYHQALDLPETLKGYIYADKVFACAKAEADLGPAIGSLIWIASDYLLIQPPLLFDLKGEFDVCARPAHIQNVGLEFDCPLDDFWRGIYQACGIEDLELRVETFIDRKSLRAYFNSHAFAVDPGLGMMAFWLDRFQALVEDQGFQRLACADDRHRIFLHSAVLSSLFAGSMQKGRLRMLPASYSYPLYFQNSVPEVDRVDSMNELVSLVYEGLSLAPDQVEGIRIDEPLRSWLGDHCS